MELELRNKDGDFIVSFKEILSGPLYKFLQSDKRIVLETRNFKNGNCNPVFTNKSTEIVSGKNDFFEVFVRPGDYVNVLI